MGSVYRYGLMLVAGLALGAGAAALQLRQSFAADGMDNGPWRMAQKVGTADAGVATRASVALRGLLALPDAEAIYFNAAHDSKGRLLAGKCSYRVSGGMIDARWWSLTLYNASGYLIANPAQSHSLGSAALDPAELGRWQMTISRARARGHWIAMPDDQPFELTLRAYHPSRTLLRTRATVVLPRIERLECRA